ncbi:MAG: hypothetical protein C4326_11350 [Ignavibacteria bacterium]
MALQVVGLYLTEQSAQALLLGLEGGRRTLHAVTEWQSTLFTYAGDDTPGVDEFVEHLSNFLSEHQRSAHMMAVALDTSLLFVNALPVDDPSGDEAIREQIVWELNEYFPGSPDNTFISDYHVMLKPDSRSYDEVLAVSVRRDVVQKLRRAATRLNLRLGVLDGDQFGAETAFHFNHPEWVKKHIALVGVKHDRIDLSILRRGDIEAYAYAFIATDQDVVQQLSTLMQQHAHVDMLMLFGERVDPELLAEIRAGISLPVEILNPFKSVTVSPTLRLKSDPTIRAFRYAAAVGVALRQK